MYRMLTGRLRQLGLQQTDVAKVLRVKREAVSHRFTGYTPWTLDEAYAVLDLIRATPEELPIYFPPGGIDKEV